jgi:uncharacterized membrane protein
VSTYLLIKLIHIVSSTVLFGTGLGTAYFKWIVDRSGNVAAIRVVSEKVVLADWLFTTPAVIVQPISGIALAKLAGYQLTNGWLAYALALYAIAGACWLVVVWLQIRMRALAREADAIGSALSDAYWHYSRAWFWLGVPAFLSVVTILGLMVFKPSY